MPKLKSCPFCGTDAVFTRSYEIDHLNQMERDWLPKLIGVNCEGCGFASIPDSHACEELAAEAWNKREDKTL